MGFLTGKRFKHTERAGCQKETGVIVSDPFREVTKNHYGNICTATCVAILWDDGSMEGAIDVELLEVMEVMEDESDGKTHVIEEQLKIEEK